MGADATKDVLKEMSTGQSIEDAQRVVNEKLKKEGKVITTTDIKNIKAKLTKEKLIVVSNISLVIQPVGVFLFFGDKEKSWNDFDNKSQEELSEMFLTYAKSKPISEVLKPVLLAGIKEPKVSKKLENECEEDVLSVDTILKDLTFASKVYLEISKLTAEFNSE